MLLLSIISGIVSPFEVQNQSWSKCAKDSNDQNVRKTGSD